MLLSTSIRRTLAFFPGSLFSDVTWTLRTFSFPGLYLSDFLAPPLLEKMFTRWPVHSDKFVMAMFSF